MRRIRLFAVVLIVVGGVGLWFSSRSRAPKATLAGISPEAGNSVVIVTLDTTRADRFGCYGSTAGLTPNLDALANQAILFEQAQATAPITLPAHTSIFSGLYPIHHGVRNNGTFSVKPEVETLAEVYSRKGYATGAFVSAEVLVKRYGLDQGFDVYDDDLSRSLKVGQSMVPFRRGDLTLEAATEWLGGIEADRPVFMWVHFYDPHAPYDPPAEFREKHPSDAYGAEIAFVDDLVSQLISALKANGRYDKTVFSVIADHGEALGEHGEQTHAILLHQGTIHVPWILRLPGHESPVRIQFPVSGVDLAPTIARLTDVPVPNAERTDGRSLFEMTPGETQVERPLYFEAMLPMYQYGWSSLRGLRRGRWEIISGTRDELFNLQRDPRELTDLAEMEGLELESLRGKLDELVDRDDATDDQALREVKPSERQALAALGYVTTSAAPRREPLDPRDMISGHVHLERSRSLMASGRFADALIDIDQMLSEDPENLAGMALQAQAQIELGHLEDAETTLRKILEIDPKSSDAVMNLCRIELQRGNFPRVIELAEVGKTTRSPFGTFDAMKARALLGMQKTDEAREVVKNALIELPDDADLLTVRAALSAKKDDKEAAEQDLRRAIEVDPYHRMARRQLGQLLLDEGRSDEAADIYKDLLRISPGDAESLYAIGTILLATNPSDAIPYLEESTRLAPGKAVNLTSLGIAYIHTNRISEAEAVLRRAAELEPDNFQIRNNLAIVLIQRGELKAAVAELEAILKSHPKHVEARNNLAIALGQLGDFKGAEEQARKALETAPGFVDAMLTLAAALHRQDRIAEEAAVLERALARSNNRPDIAVQAAIASSLSDKCDRTLQLLEPILSTPGARLSPDAHLAAARCFEAASNASAALRSYEEAARLAPEGPLRKEAAEGVQRLSLRVGPRAPQE